MLSSIGRAAVHRLAPKAPATSCRQFVASSLVSRVSSQQNALGWLRFTLARSFASDATTARTRTTVKTSPKKVTVKTTVKPKKTTAKKTGTKAKAKKKPAKKATPKKTPRAKKELTQVKKEALQLKDLKKKSLYAEEPRKTVPEQTWGLYVSQNATGATAGVANELGRRSHELASAYKSLTASERSQLENQAAENKLVNAAKLKAWIELHTPLAIHNANVARQALRRKFSYPKRSFHLIKDDRQPKRTVAPYMYYLKARWASGDYAHTSAVVAFKEIADSWKSLSASEKEPYIELSKSDSQRYVKETDSAFGLGFRRS